MADKEAEIQRKQKYSIDVYQDYKSGVLTNEEYLELKASFKEEISTLESEIEALQEEADKIAKDNEDKVQWAERFIRYRGFEELSRELLLRLVDEIRVYDKDRIEVLFKFRAEYEALCQYVSCLEGNKEGGAVDGKKKQEECQ